MKVQFRVDGVLAQAATIARRMAAGVISRIKIMANLDIAEKRLPQDGRLAVTVDGRRIDVRVVTLPLVKGEGVVMRILDTRAVVRELESLGMQDSERKKFVAAVHQALRRGARHRPDRLGQVDDALRRSVGRQRRREEHPHDRGSGRVADRRHQADAGVGQDRRHLRDRPALDAARRPRRDHGRRDPRPRDRRDRNPGRAHRPPRAVDAAHARCRQRAGPAHRHGGRAVHGVGRDRLRRRSAPCAPAVRQLQACGRRPGRRPRGRQPVGASSFTSRWAACAAATPAIRVASASTR